MNDSNMRLVGDDGCAGSNINAPSAVHTPIEEESPTETAVDSSTIDGVMNNTTITAQVISAAGDKSRRRTAPSVVGNLKKKRGTLWRKMGRL